MSPGGDGPGFAAGALCAKHDEVDPGKSATAAKIPKTPLTIGILFTSLPYVSAALRASRAIPFYFRRNGLETLSSKFFGRPRHGNSREIYA
jgi:hypothetical protein